MNPSPRGGGIQNKVKSITRNNKGKSVSQVGLKRDAKAAFEEEGECGGGKGQAVEDVSIQTAAAGAQPHQSPPTSMTSLAWNCRGLGNRRTVRELANIVQAEGPKIVFLFETWSGRKHMEKFKRELEFDGLFTVPSDGRGGGLALLWKSEMDVWVDSFFEIPH